MTSLQANQDRHGSGEQTAQSAMLFPDAPAGCDQCGRCGDPERACSSSRVPVLLMSRGVIETLRAVEMKSMALSADDVRCMVDTDGMDDSDDAYGGEAMGYEAGHHGNHAAEVSSQLALSF